MPSSTTEPRNDIEGFYVSLDALDVLAVRGLLEASPELAGSWRRTDYGGWESPLHVAAKRGSLDMARLLVEAGAEVYAVRQADYPPVFEAWYSRNQALVDYLLEASTQSDEGLPPTFGCGIDIGCAGRLGMLDRIRMHLERDPWAIYRRGCIGETVLHWPAHNGHVEVVHALISAGADIEADAIGLYGGKPLHWAAEHAPACVQALLDHGADPNARNLNPGDRHGFTPLHMCASQREECTECADHLLRAGANLHAVDSTGRTPLQVAREGGFAAMANFLESADRR